MLACTLLASHLAVMQLAMTKAFNVTVFVSETSTWISSLIYLFLQTTMYFETTCQNLQIPEDAAS